MVNFEGRWLYGDEGTTNLGGQRSFSRERFEMYRRLFQES
jgi:hypothetical protein